MAHGHIAMEVKCVRALMKGANTNIDTLNCSPKPDLDSIHAFSACEWWGAGLCDLNRRVLATNTIY